MVPNFYMMVGLPASGKTIKALEIHYKSPYVKRTTVHSSDALREDLLGDIEDQSRNREIFDILHSLVKADLYKGHSTIYDATNLNSKRRKEFLDSLSLLPCKKICIYMKTPYEVCLERNHNRERKVPTLVMERMERSLDPPVMEEGWDMILEIGYNPEEEI